jgi:heptosyltransferase-1
MIREQSGGVAEPVNCSVAQLIALTRRVALVIAGDTGPLHLACALGRPVVGIYGPTDPARNGPFGTRSRVLRSPHSRRDHSRRSEPEAGLLTITPEDVIHAADELLAGERVA